MAEAVYVSVGAPSGGSPCERCDGWRYRFPLAGLALSGVHDLGTAELCPQCESASATVTRWREAPQ